MKHYVGLHEQIGSFEIKTEREKIEAEPLLPLPDTCFPAEGIDPRVTFQCQKEYLSPEELEQALTRAGFAEISFFGDFDFNAPDERCERWYVAARCKK